MLPDWLERIRADNVSGAVPIALRAAQGLIEWAASAERSPAELEAITHALVRAQPRMAPLFNLANAVLHAGPEGVEPACRKFMRRVETAAGTISRTGADLIPEGGVTFTHSFSSTVLNALKRAAEGGKHVGVICTESRPMREGVALAKQLGAAGVPVRLIADAAMSLLLPEAQIVLVGADSVSPAGLVNKIGTSLLALAASDQHIPVYALCGSDKFLPASYRLPPDQPRNPLEVLEEPAAGVIAVNYYFDVTPLEHFTGIVTEEGILTAEELNERLEGLSA